MKFGNRIPLVIIVLISSIIISATYSNKKSDLNSISRQHLESIPGIGASLSSKIIIERNRRGGFRQMEDLLKIRGIGLNLLARLKQYLYVNKPAQSQMKENHNDQFSHNYRKTRKRP
ncbi:helix-hairpin-helix domain-containing protein [bacterium]|nr:helix-hairpin-helix domain-containing protein [bacterium]